MRKNNLSKKGLSLSQAQSISNLCNQRALFIDSQLSSVNNFSKKIKVDGEEHVIQQGNRLSENVVDLVKEKAGLHACQAFLMENIKAKDTMLNNIRTGKANILDIEVPRTPTLNQPELLDEVDEEWGWEQLTTGEFNEYLEAESYAAHIGNFIHKRSILDELRKELPNIPSVEWMTIEDGKKTPVTIHVHHKANELLEVHEKFAAEHRKYEQRVNYFKAKVKNLVTKENARVAKLNADAVNNANELNENLQAEYKQAMVLYNSQVNVRKSDFEKLRQSQIEEISSYRINIDARFQDTVDKFLNELETEKE